MTIDTKAIRIAAEAATPEPWIQSGAGNMPFICMMTPSTVIALLDRLEAAEKDAVRYQWLRDCEDDFTDAFVEKLGSGVSALSLQLTPQ